MKPDLTPECPRGHAVGSSPDRRVVAIGLALVGPPVAIGVAAAILVLEESIGPVITLALWLAMFAIPRVRTKAGMTFIEWIAVLGCLVVLQLLLDLHTRYLGDLVIAGLHVAGAIALLVVRWHRRRAR